ncbi:hypothetical protein Cva_00851 [Caedimonas varicaedens]|uniref:Uncharacterized protein n=1 Tax=Caedimonas varicaedens TaxID=1629334 RepID=A0A0K8MDA3_9PROT|nr:hypothetical protein Cva_00851 [Caedimonas varicaedens]
MNYLSGYTDPFMSPVSGKLIIPFSHVLLGDDQNHSFFSPTILQDNLPDLQSSHIWLGIPQVQEDQTILSRPMPFDLNTVVPTPATPPALPYPVLTKLAVANPDVPDDQHYTTFAYAQPNEDYAYGGEPFVALGQYGDKKLPHAQTLNELYNIALTPNILKLSLQLPDPLHPENLPFGKIEIAIPGIDFLTLADLEIAEVVIFENIGQSIIGAVSGKVIEVIPDPEHPDKKIKKIETTFQDNAVFPGNISITIPMGGDDQRPDPTPEQPVVGMFRYNSDTNYFEGGYNDGWKKMYGEAKPTYITDTFGDRDNFYIGTQCGTFADGGSASRNVAIGLNVLSSPTNESDSHANPIENVAVGYNALKNCGNAVGVSAARYNVAVGFSSQEFSSGDYNVSLGHQALQYCGFVKNSVAIGQNALSRSGVGPGIWSMLSPGGNHVAIGQSTLENMFKGEHNVAIGANALQYPANIDTLGIPLSGYIDGSVAIGYCALQGNSLERFQTVTDGSVAIGAYAGANYAPFAAKPLGSPNVFIGYSAARMTRSGSSNIAIGYRTLFYLNADSTNPLTAESRHIAIGDRASLNFTTSHSWLTQHPNLAIGVDALGSNSTGRGNIAIGDSALSSVTGSNVPLVGKGGDFCIGLGYQADTGGQDSGTLVNAIAIGAYAKVESSNSIVLGGADHDNDVYYPDVAIGHNNPQYSLHIKNTGQGDKAVIALAETHSIPSFQDKHVYFYSQSEDAYFRSDALGSKKIGVKSVGTDHQIVIEDDFDDSTQKKISLAENPTIPGTKYVMIPGGSQAERDAILEPKVGMIRYTTH